MAVQDVIDEIIEQFAQLGRLDLVGDRLGAGAVLVDQLLGFGEDLRLGEQLPNAFHNAAGLGSVAAFRQQRQQLVAISAGGRFQGERQQQRRPGGEHVLTGCELVVAVAFPIFEVVENLKGDAEVLAEVGDFLFVIVGRPGEANAGVQGGLESGGRLKGVDFQGVQGGQRLVLGVAPEQFGPLALGQFQVGVGHTVEDVGGAVAAEFLALAADEPIAEAEQVIADVDGGGDAVLTVQRFPAVAEGVVVLNVVVDERRLVERLDGQGGAPDAVGKREAVGRARAGAPLRAS